MKLKETISLMVSHQNQLSKIIGEQGHAFGLNPDDPSSPGMFLTGRGSTQMQANSTTVSKVNQTPLVKQMSQDQNNSGR